MSGVGGCLEKLRIRLTQLNLKLEFKSRDELESGLFSPILFHVTYSTEIKLNTSSNINIMQYICNMDHK